MNIEKHLGRKLPEDIKVEVIEAKKYSISNEAHLHHLQNAASIATKQKEKLILTYLLNEQSRYYYFNTKIDDAIRYAKMGMNLSIQTNNKKMLCDFYCNLSAFYIYKNLLDKAVVYAFEALKLQPKIEQEETIYMNLGIIFRKKKDAKSALFYLKKAIEIDKQNPISRSTYIYSNIGNIYLDIGNVEKSIVHFKLALKNFRTGQDDVSVKLLALEGLGEALILQGERVEALDYFKEAIKIAISKNKQLNTIHLKYNIGGIYKEWQDYEKALAYFEEALDLAKKCQLKDLQLMVLKTLQETYFLNGELGKAYTYQGELLKEKEALLIREQAKNLDILITKKEKEINILEEQNEQITQQNKELKQYAHIIAHDLQEPLRNVNGFASLLKKQCKKDISPKAKEYLSYLTKASQQMHEQLNGLLHYVSISRNKERNSTINLEELLTKISLLSKEKINNNKINIVYDNMPVVYGNQVQLEQLFQHLICNAIKFRDSKRSCTIEISYKEQEKAYAFMVKDNGIGIHKNYLKKIFDIFNRIDKTNYDGIGIGLAICKKIVENHNGIIYAQSNGKNETIICFTLSKKKDTFKAIVNEII